MKTLRWITNCLIDVAKNRVLGALFEHFIERTLKGGETPVQQAVLRAVCQEFQPRERAILAQIEQIRREYLQSRQEIELLYYGTGGPTRSLSPQAMDGGVMVRETVGWGVSRISSPPWKGRILFSLIRSRQPEAVLELGTGYGISGLYQIAALEMNAHGQFYTVDGSVQNLHIAEEMFGKLDSRRWRITAGPLQEILPAMLEQIARVNLVFLDADHSYRGTMNYLDAILPHLTTGGLLVLDDIRWSREMYRAWREICQFPEIHQTIDLYAIGICAKG